MFYLKIDVETLIGRVLESRGMDFWESGMDLKHGDDIYDSFRAYQNKLLREYASMADEFHFRVVDARRSVDRIQDELRSRSAAFLEPLKNRRSERSRAEVSRQTGPGIYTAETVANSDHRLPWASARSGLVAVTPVAPAMPPRSATVPRRRCPAPARRPAEDRRRRHELLLRRPPGPRADQRSRSSRTR